MEEEGIRTDETVRMMEIMQEKNSEMQKKQEWKSSKHHHHAPYPDHHSHFPPFWGLGLMTVMTRMMMIPSCMKSSHLHLLHQFGGQSEKEANEARQQRKRTNHHE